MNLNPIIKLYIHNNAQYQIKKAMQKYGIEKTEEIINKVYTENETIKQIMLTEYRNLIKG